MGVEQIAPGVRRQLLAGLPADAILGAVERAGLDATDCGEAIASMNRQGRDAIDRQRATTDQAYFMMGVYRRLRSAAAFAVKETAPIAEEHFYAEYYEQNRPLIVRGLYDRCTRYSFEMLCREHGDVEIDVSRGRTSAPFLERSPKRTVQRMPLRAYVEEVTSEDSADHYMTADARAVLGPLGAIVGALFPENGLLRVPSPDDASLWVGPRGALTPYHYDIRNVVIAQVVGTKRVYLAPPEDYPFMSCRAELRASPIDPLQPDYGEYPAFRFATISVAEISAGDALFVPVGWWHAVVSTEPSFSASLTSFRRLNAFSSDLPFLE